MSLETDLLLDRRHLKRRLFLWRGAAVLAVVGSLAIAALNNPDITGGRDHVARVTVAGTIGEDRRLVAAITAVSRDTTARALLVMIDSPGGAPAAGEALHGAIAAVAAKKPVAAVMAGTAASAGYMVALPADRIFAREATLTGSIGVKLTLAEGSVLLERLGVSSESITSGPLKDEPSLARRLTPQGREVLQGLVSDLHRQFVEMVAAGRRMPVPQIEALADGRAYSGRQALKLGLIDEIGGEAEARAWLAAVKEVAIALPVRDVGRRGLAERALAEEISDWLASVLKTVLSQTLSLDAVGSLWQRPSSGG